MNIEMAGSVPFIIETTIQRYYPSDSTDIIRACSNCNRSMLSDVHSHFLGAICLLRISLYNTHHCGT